MASENLEFIRDGYARLESEGWESLIDSVHPDFEFTTPPDLASEPGTYRGEEGIRRYFESFYEAMDELHFDPQDFIDAGENMVVVPTNLRARGRGSGIEVEQQVTVLWTFKDGLILSNQAFASTAEALAAAEHADRDRR